MSAIPIRVRLTVAFAAAMVCVIGAMAVLVYVRVGGALMTSVDQTLRAQASEAVTHAHDEHGLVDPDAASGVTLAQVVDAAGHPVKASQPGLVPLLSRREAVRSAEGATILRTVSLQRPRGEWRILAEPVPSGGAIVVARSLAARNEALHRIFRELLVVGPLVVLLASLAGYALAAAALRPVEMMRRRAARVTPSSPGLLPVSPARDEISRLAVTLNDMLTRLHAALEHERRFVADASHELRTPVALLRTELELALRRPRTAEELTLAIHSALDETVRLSRLADDLLLLARAEEGSLPLRRERMELSELFDEVAARFANRAQGAGRRVRAVPTADFIEGDPVRLEQALNNLVDNALTYGTGEVEIFATSRNGAVELHVADHGAGFDEAFLERAFDRFSRADDSRAGAGAGLGLSIVQLIADVHGGSVGAANRPNGGADVWLTVARTSV
jgi:two-component system, OmpR family, sensor kinase